MLRRALEFATLMIAMSLAIVADDLLLILDVIDDILHLTERPHER